MNDRRKMPDGHRETSPRSSASKSEALIFVLAEMDDSGICLRSRSFRRRAHKGISGMLSSDIIGTRAAGASSVPVQCSSARPRRAWSRYTLEGRNCAMSLTLLRGDGGALVLPDRVNAACQPGAGRQSGGQSAAIGLGTQRAQRGRADPVRIPRRAPPGRAMIDVLPQLAGGCINYWEAGNWALNDEAEPRGRKEARSYRQMHLHLLGRSPASTDPAWKWGESPRFPAFAERHSWAAAVRTADRRRVLPDRQPHRRAAAHANTVCSPDKSPTGRRATAAGIPRWPARVRSAASASSLADLSRDGSLSHACRIASGWIQRCDEIREERPETSSSWPRSSGTGASIVSRARVTGCVNATRQA